MYLSTIPIYSPGFKALASIAFGYLADTISYIFFQRAITQERGIILMGKKKLSAIFS